MSESDKALSSDSKTASTAPAPSGKPLSRALKLFYGVGDCGFTLMSNVETYYFVYFLTNFALFDAATAAIISGVGAGVDAVLGWMYGGFINSMKPRRRGRYRGWLILTTWLVPFLFALEFTRFSENTALAAVLIILFNVLSHAAWDFPYVANVSMIAVAGSTPEDRSHLASTRAMWANFSKVIFSYLFPPVALIGAKILGESGQYAFAAFVFGMVMALMYAVHYKMFKGYEKEYTKEELANYKRGQNDQGRTTFADLGRALVKNPPLIFLMFSDIAKWVFNFMCAGIAAYYFTYVVFEPAMLATYIFISNVLSVIGSYLSTGFGKLMKSTKMATVVAFLFMAACLVAARLSPMNMWLVIILMSLGQFAYGITYASTVALYADTVVYAEWRMKKNAAGWISGLQLFPLKLGFVARGVAVPAVLGAAGWMAQYATASTDGTLTPDMIPQALQDGICNGFMLYPAIILLIAAALLFFGYRLTPAKLKEYQAEIDERKAQEAQEELTA